MSESGEASGPPIRKESFRESDEDSSDSDFNAEEIEKEILGVRSTLRRHCGRHKVLTKSFNDLEGKNTQDKCSSSNSKCIPEKLYPNTRLKFSYSITL